MNVWILLVLVASGACTTTNSFILHAQWSDQRRGFFSPICKAGGVNLISPKSLRSMTPSEFATLHDHVNASPAILRGVWEHGDKGREEWCHNVVEKLADTEIEFQLQRETHSELLTGRFEEFLDAVYDSDHNKALFLFDENLMAQHEDLRKTMTSLPEEYFGRNLFEAFPAEVRPKDACLIIGGRGARSTLHADPFDWMGTNYCLEGSKLWTFIAPDKPLPQALEAYRVEPNAWAPEDDEKNAGQKNHNQQRPEIAAGWQSDLNIYDAPNLFDEWPKSEVLAGMSPPHRIAALDDILTAASRIVPQGKWRQMAYTGKWRVGASRIHVALQREGDLVLIPPGWWHQTLHLEPSIALASQYTNQRSIHAVLEHVSQWCALKREAIEPFCTVDDTFLDFPAIAAAMDDILGQAIALK